MAKKLTKKQLAAIHAKGQTARGIAQDKRKTAKNTLPATETNVAKWEKAPGKMDIKGVDTKAIIGGMWRTRDNHPDAANIFVNDELNMVAAIRHNPYLGNKAYYISINGRINNKNDVNKGFKTRAAALKYIETYNPKIVNKIEEDRDDEKIEYRKYSKWAQQIASTTSKRDIEKEIRETNNRREKYATSHLNAIERSTSMQSNSQARAQTGNVMRANYDTMVAYENALEIYKNYPQHTKDGNAK